MDGGAGPVSRETAFIGLVLRSAEVFAACAPDSARGLAYGNSDTAAAPG